jgi:hypothetical protein
MLERIHRMKRLLTLLTLSAFALALPAGSFAAEKAKAPATDTKKAAEKPAAPAAEKETAKTDRPLPYRGDVAAADPTAKTFTFKSKDGNERVFIVTEKTEITKDGAKADFSAIAVGAYATGSYHKTPDGKLEAASVKIAEKPEKTEPVAEKTPEKKAPEKK